MLHVFLFDKPSLCGGVLVTAVSELLEIHTQLPSVRFGEEFPLNSTMRLNYRSLACLREIEAALLPFQIQYNAIFPRVGWGNRSSTQKGADRPNLRIVLGDPGRESEHFTV